MIDDADSLRAPLAFRMVIGVVGIAVVVFNVALMISDRAPSASRLLFGDFARRLSDRLDASGRVDTARLPANDAIVHIGVWAIAAFLVALTLWRWWGLAVVAAGVFGVSVIVEFAQGRYSSTRAIESSDIAANGVGVAIGTAAAFACMLLWAAVSAVIRGIRRRRR